MHILLDMFSHKPLYLAEVLVSLHLIYTSCDREKDIILLEVL